MANIKIIRNDKCIPLGSDACRQLIDKTEDIMSALNSIPGDIFNFTTIVGQYERSDAPIFDPDKIDAILNDNAVTKTMKKLNQELVINHKYIDGILTRSFKTADGVKFSTPYVIIDSKLFFTGDLSLCLIMEFTMHEQKQNNTELVLINSVAKIYPFDVATMPNSRYDIIEKNKLSNFKNAMKYMFIKEGFIGCWISSNLLANKITSTFACVYDSYILKGLPITHQQYVHQELMLRLSKKKFDKKWLQSLKNKDVWDKSINNSYGFIEMEKIDCTLEQLMKESDYFDLGCLFEILYSKMVLAFCGNVYMTDDHGRNIMMKNTNVIRCYTIVRRKTQYQFFIDNPYIVKFIDFERFKAIHDRNFYMESTNDNRIKFYFLDYSKGNPTKIYPYSQCVKPSEKNIATTMFELFNDPLKCTIDGFCEIMWRCLPNKYLDGSLYTGKKIESYFIDLDIEQDKTKFMNPVSATDIPINIPHVPLKVGGKNNKKYVLKNK